MQYQKNLSVVFEKSDFFAALIVGETVAWLTLAIVKNLEIEIPFLGLALILFPILSVVGLYFCYLIAKKIAVFFQVGKYILVGFLNTFLDWGILNLLIFLSGVASGALFVFFKAVSFFIPTINSFFWNKFWTFKKKDIDEVLKKNTRIEFLQFLVISLVGILLNVGIASLIVLGISPQLGLTEKIWANVGAFFGTIVSMVWNFIGYKFIVFKT